MLQTALAVAAAVVAVAFAMSTFDRWLVKRRPHELVWTVAFSLFAVAAVFLAAGTEGGWTPTRFRGFFLFGAILNVPVLALGSLLLFLRSEWTRRIAMWLTAGFCLFSAGVMVATPLTGPLPLHELAQGSEVFGVWPRLLAGIGSGVGATVIFVGAIYSAARTTHRRFWASNGLIALGTAILGASGMFNSIAGAMAAFSISLTLGVCVLFCGFLVATSAPQKIAIDLDQTPSHKFNTPAKVPVESVK